MFSGGPKDDFLWTDRIEMLRMEKLNYHGLQEERDDTVSLVLEALNTDEKYGIIGDRRDLNRRR